MFKSISRNALAFAPSLFSALSLFLLAFNASAQTTSGNSTTGSSLFTSKGCSGCHAATGPTKANAINAGGHITHANTQGMGGAADSSGTDYANIAAYFATLFTDLAAQSVTHNTAKTITIPNFFLNTSYGDYVGLRAVTAPARGSVAYTLGSLDVVYTPTTNQCGSDSFTYEAYRTVNTGTSNTRTVSLTIANPTAANISGSSGTISGTVGTAITNFTPSNSGGTATSYAITSGTLPSGLSLNTSTGVISGTPTANGTSTITLTPYNCLNGTTNGQAGTAKSITLTLITTPGAPTIGTVTPGNAQLSVAFTAPASNGNSTITGYTATCGAFSNTGTASPIVVSGLTNGTSYSCSVRATNAAGTGSASGTASGTPRTVPGAPTIGTATAGTTSASVTFTAPASNGGSTITGYTATCGSGSNTGTASPITVSSLTAGTAVTCSVIATNAAGNSSASSASNSITPYTTPGAPTIGTATPGNASLSVSFTAPASNGFSTITGYTANCGGFTNSGSGSPIVVSGLTNGLSYSCGVYATNAAGNSSTSGTTTGTPRTVPGAPTIGTATAGVTIATVSFTAPASNGGSAITGYTATCGSGSNTGSASPITVSGLAAGTAVTCTVVANNAAGISSASSASNSVTPYDAPGAPAIIGIAPGNGSLVIAFTAAASNGSAITLYHADCGAASATGTSSPITVNGLTNGTTYMCLVYATNAAGDGPSSSLSSGTPATVPGAPTIGTATAGDAQISVAFTAPASNGGATITSYTATCGSSNASGSSSPITVTGLTNGTAYTCTATATNSAGTGAASSASNSATPIGTQTITFGTAPTPTFVVNGTFTVSATGGLSGNPIVYSSLTTSVCTASSATVTMLALGTCTIAANQ
ncbi:MAG: fibronectin type III domain-containing protein, partial [Betaproteobacteria bacterium]|nr:fibronectin type III domain-containing protein [Betaproteobacteria bacterium]